MKPKRAITVFLIVIALLAAATTAYAQSATVGAVAEKINRARLDRGLTPFAISGQLMASAQSHADDLARTGKYGHTGSDGSTLAVRVARAGYGAYSWGRRVGEIYAVYHSLDSAMDFWMKSKPHRDNILHPVYREMGIGIALRDGLTIYVVDFGAQPNVLPAFINDGAGQTGGSSVNLTLNDEPVYDSSPSVIQQVKQVQISNESTFAGTGWQPFSKHMNWTLAPGEGTRTVYVKYQDDRGRTTTTSDSISVGTTKASMLPAIAPSTTATSRPSQTPTRKPSATSTRTATFTATLTRTMTPTQRPSPTATRTMTPTARPSPTASPTATYSPQPSIPSVANQPVSTPAIILAQLVMETATPTLVPPTRESITKLEIASGVESIPVVAQLQTARMATGYGEDSYQDADSGASLEPTLAEVVTQLAGPIFPFALGVGLVGLVIGAYIILVQLARPSRAPQHQKRG